MKLPTKKLQFIKGFTLIELLIVIGVIGILATITLAAVNPITQIQKAKDSQRKSDLGQIQKALQLYYQDNNSFPYGTSDGKILNGVTAVSWGDVWIVNGQIYMQKLPQDPNMNYNYFYLPSTDLQSYRLFAHLEHVTNDPQACTMGYPSSGYNNICDGDQANVFCQGNAQYSCNFELTSPNNTPIALPTIRQLPNRQP